MTVDGYNPVPTFERSPQEIRQSIQDEVAASDAVIRTFPGSVDVPVVESWQLSDPEEIPLALGFRRARAVIQALSYGEDYWPLFRGLAVDLGERPVEESPEVTAKTERLLHLAILSRVPVRQVDEYWSMPSADDIRDSKQRLRKELFIASTPDIGDFSQITYDELLDDIVAGYVSIGDPEYGDVQCWRPKEKPQSWSRRARLAARTALSEAFSSN
jgi:hypothetical protein